MSSTDRVRLKNLPPAQLCSGTMNHHVQQQHHQHQAQPPPIGFGTLPARRRNAGTSSVAVSRPRRPLSQTLDDNNEFNNLSPVDGGVVDQDDDQFDEQNRSAADYNDEAAVRDRLLAFVPPPPPPPPQQQHPPLPPPPPPHNSRGRSYGQRPLQAASTTGGVYAGHYGNGNASNNNNNYVSEARSLMSQQPPPPAVLPPTIGIPIPPPPAEPPPGTPRDSIVLGGGGGGAGGCHYAETGLLQHTLQSQHANQQQQQQYCSVDSANAFYLPAGQVQSGLGISYGNGGGSNGPGAPLSTTSDRRLFQQQQQQQQYDSRAGVYDTAGSLRHRPSKLASPLINETSLGAVGFVGGHFLPSGTDSSGGGGGGSGIGGVGNFAYPGYSSGKKPSRFQWSTKITIAILLLFILMLIAAVGFFAARSADLEKRIEISRSQNLTLFGLFDPNAPPPDEIPTLEAVQLTLEPTGYWSGKVTVARACYLLVNISLHYQQVVGLYLRRNSLPTAVRHDFFHKLVNVQSQKTHALPLVHFATPGIWYVSLINDQRHSTARLRLRVTKTDLDYRLNDCNAGCSNRGACQNGVCQCFPGFKGPDCSLEDTVQVCSGNGYFDRGSCRCHPQWKGPECSVPWTECLDPLCSGNGRCVAGQCQCSAGFSGDKCENVACQPSPNCNNRGQCQSGRCRCFSGYSGAACELEVAGRASSCDPVAGTDPRCSGRGRFRLDNGGSCDCDTGYYGDSCQFESCMLPCENGICTNGTCRCFEGWSGLRCHLRSCDKRCERNGVCVNGTCVCNRGWNGPSCTLDGCPNACNNRGNCERSNSPNGDWRCVCVGGGQWRGAACQFPVEGECTDGLDNDGDGLIDCNDPDCCRHSVCRSGDSCISGTNPRQVLLSEPPLPLVSSFERRVKFLIGKESVQLFASISFDPNFMSVVVGRLILPDGSSVMACRVWDEQNALVGNTLSRSDGTFLLVVVGGKAVKLSFARVFNRDQNFNLAIPIFVPTNTFLHLGTVVMSSNPGSHPDAQPLGGQMYTPTAGVQSCPEGGHDYYQLRPRVHVSYHIDELPSAWSTTPSRNEPVSSIYLEKQSLKLQVPVPDAPFNLVYVSTRSIGYHTALDIQLTGERIPDGLAEVLCHVSIGGSLFKRRFEANTNLTYTFQWDRMDMFGRPYTGLVEARISVGYKYANCPEIVWDFASALMSGIELVPSRLGQWSLDIVHAYDFVKGVIHRGDGSTEYLSQRPWIISTEAGNGVKRPPNCGNECRLSSGGVDLTAARLLSPVALAVTNAGHLVIGDGRFIRVADWPANAEPGARRLRLRTVHEQPVEMDATVYYLANDITQRSGRAAVFISDPFRRQIYQIKLSEHESIDHQLIAGSGDACYGDTAQYCGDGGPARLAKLIEPKGLAIDRRGVLYFADGPNIRRLVPNGDSSIDDRATIETVVGQGNSVIDYVPWPCYKMVRARSIKLRWPSSLAYNPVDDSVYFLDDQSVMRLTPDGFVHVVAGRPPHCPPPLHSSLRHLAAFEETLLEPRGIAFSHRGEMYITEAMLGATAPRIRVLRSDGRLHPFSGQYASPSEPMASDVLLGPASRARFGSLGALAVSPFGEVFVADREVARVYKLHQQLPLRSESRTYQVMSADTTELFTFNSDGKHVRTEDTVTGVVKYNFSHSSFDNNLGAAVLSIHIGSRQFVFNHSRLGCEIIRPGGGLTSLTYDNTFGYVEKIEDHQRGLNLSLTYDRFYTSIGDSLETKSRGYLTGLTTGKGRSWQFDYHQSGDTAPSGDGSAEVLGHLAAITYPDGRRQKLRRRILSDKGVRTDCILGKDDGSTQKSGFSLPSVISCGAAAVSGLNDASSDGSSISFDLSDLGQVTSSLADSSSQIGTRVQWFPQLGYSLQLSTRISFNIARRHLDGSSPGSPTEWRNASWTRVAIPAQYRSVIDANQALIGHHPGLTRADLEVAVRGASDSSLPGFHQKVFKINDQPVLLISYQPADRTESYSISRSGSAGFDLLFTIAYNDAGLPVGVTPNPLVCLYRSVQFIYHSDGHQLAELVWSDRPRTASERTGQRESRHLWQFERQASSGGQALLVAAQERYSTVGSAGSEVDSAGDVVAEYRFGYATKSTKDGNCSRSNLPSTIANPVGGIFHFQCDSTGGLQSVGTPDNVTHKFLASWGLATNRILYWPCTGCSNPFEFHYGIEEYLESLHYPSQTRRLSFVLWTKAKLRRVAFDQAYTEVAYVDDTKTLPSVLRTVYFDDTKTNVSQTFDFTGGLLRKESIKFDCSEAKDHLADVSHEYRHNSGLRIVGIETVIKAKSGRLVASRVNVTRDPISGGITRLNDLSLESRVSRREHSIRLRDAHCTRRFQFDSLARLAESTLHCGVENRRAFVLSVHGHSRGRLQEQVYRIGDADGANSGSSVAYQTNKLGLVVSASAAAAAASPTGTNAPGEAFEYTPAGRIMWRSISSSFKSFEQLNYTYDSRTGLPKSVGPVQYVFDVDGFMTTRFNRLHAGSVESFRHDAKGLLRRAEAIDSSGRRIYSLRYVYDAQDRLIAKLNRLQPRESLQLFYADPEHPKRVMHVLAGAGLSEQTLITCRYEDRTGQLVAIETGESDAIVRYYVVSDYFGSPLALFNQRGEVAMQLSYSITGERTIISNNPTAPLLPFGYRLGLQDSDTGLVLLRGSRPYDPYLGQWTGPDPIGLFSRLAAALKMPESIDAYRFDHLSPTENSPPSSSFADVSQPEYWLNAFNIDAKRLLKVKNVVSMTTKQEDDEDILMPRLHRSPVSSETVAVKSVFQTGIKRRLDSFEQLRGAFDFVLPLTSSIRAPPLASEPAFLHPELRPTYTFNGRTTLKSLVELSSLPEQILELANFALNGTRLLPQRAETLTGGRRLLLLHREASSSTNLIVQSLKRKSSASGEAAKFSVLNDELDGAEVRVDFGSLSASVRCTTSSLGAEAKRLALVGLQRAGERLMRAESALLSSGTSAGATRFAWSHTAIQELRQNGVAANYRPVSVSDEPLLWDDPGNVYFVPTE